MLIDVKTYMNSKKKCIPFSRTGYTKMYLVKNHERLLFKST